MKTRICRICSMEKPTSQYYRTGRGHPTSYCKPCYYNECRRRLGKEVRVKIPEPALENPFVIKREPVQDFHHLAWSDCI